MPPTPIQILGRTPDHQTVVHEAGHMLMAMDLGIPGSSIEFPMVLGTDQARHWASSEACDPEAVVRMILAGPVSQALVCPDTVDLDLRDKLAAPVLFQAPECLNGESDAEMMMMSNGFGGDWLRMMAKVAVMARAIEDRRQVLLANHRFVVDCCGSERFRNRHRALVEDIESWLREENDWLPSPGGQGMVMYPGSRAVALLAGKGS